MKLSKNWAPIIDKFKNKLSKWKARNLSFGGRLTLIKSVLNSLPVYYFSLFKAPKKVLHTLDVIRRRFLWGGDEDKRKIHWVAWEEVVKPKKDGGLGVGCLESLNLSLLAKWWWRIKLENKALWLHCLKAIHKFSLLDGKVFAKRSIKGTWFDIALLNIDFDLKGVNLEGLFKRIVGKGDRTHFWKDKWCAEMPLKDLFRSLYACEKQKNCLISARVCLSGSVLSTLTWDWNHNLGSGVKSAQLSHLVELLGNFSFNSSSDSWRWNGDGSTAADFSTGGVRSVLCKSSNHNRSFKFVWVNWIPIKINCFAWRVFRNRIPTFVNLSKRGMSVGDKLCPMCSDFEEDTNHLFFNCCFAVSIWRWMRVSSKLPGPDFDSIESLSKVLECVKSPKNHRKTLMAIIYSTIWFIWKARNSRVFNNEIRRAMCVADDVVANCFNWIKDRSKNLSLPWFDWCVNPYVSNSLQFGLAPRFAFLMNLRRSKKT